MITSNIPAYAEIIGQAALLAHFAATEDDPRSVMAHFYRGQVQAYGHAARLLVKAHGMTDLVDQDIRSEHQRLWAPVEQAERLAARTVHTGTFRESCASHDCAGCAA